MTISSTLLLPPLIAFAISLAGLMAILSPGVTRYLAMDQPNQRSLHSRPVPRSGGIAIIIATLVAWSLLLEPPPPLLLLVAVLAGVSYTDDWKGLPVIFRLAAHAVAAMILLWSGMLGLQPGFWLAAGLAAYVVWMTNAYNFMDGADGLAGGMAVCGFSAYGLAACSAPTEGLAAMCFTVAAAAAGFLPFNFPPAKIFMGDVGAIPLGFLAAVLGLMGWQLAAWPLWFPLLVFSPFLVDASITLLRRLVRGERFWQAHSQHYYQRLVKMGWGHRRTALSEYLLMAAVGASALAGLRFSAQAQMSMLAGWLVIFAGLMLATDHAWRRFMQAADERC